MRRLMWALVAASALSLSVSLSAQAQMTKPAVGSQEVYWVVTFSIPQGQLDNFKKVVAPLVQDTAKEPGALEYEYLASADGRTVDIVERYADSQAAITHVTQTFGPKYSKDFLAIAKPERFVVYGAPNDEIKKVLEGFNPTYMTAFDGFTRGAGSAELVGSSTPPANANK